MSASVVEVEVEVVAAPVLPKVREEVVEVAVREQVEKRSLAVASLFPPVKF